MTTVYLMYAKPAGGFVRRKCKSVVAARKLGQKLHKKGKVKVIQYGCIHKETIRKDGSLDFKQFDLFGEDE